MQFAINVRVTRKKRSPEGFYAIFNGKRIRFNTKPLALSAVDSFLQLQRIQVVTVRQYAARLPKSRMPQS